MEFQETLDQENSDKPARWIKIKESCKLPPDNVDVIGWDGFRMLIVSCEHYGMNKEHLEWCWRDEGRDDNWNSNGNELTHWLDGIPLPPRK